jgi:MPBQ/MSBQ methyltransferase
MRSEAARLFDAMAESYEELEPWYEELYARLHAILTAELGRAGDDRASRALDAGCGTGFQTTLLETLGYETHGVDISAGLLGVAREKRSLARLALASVEALPYPDASFDAVTCCGSTLSFVDAADRALSEMGRVLRPDGVLLVECEHKWSLDLAWELLSALTFDSLGYGVSPVTIWRQLARPLRQGFWLDYPVALPGGRCEVMRLRTFTSRELGTMLATAGFEPVKAWGIHALTNLIPSTVLHRERLGPVARKTYRALCALDRAMAGARPARWLANSLVVLARRVSSRRTSS